MQGDFQVGHWLVQPLLGTIKDGDRAVRLEPKVMRVLVCLAEQSGNVVEKEHLIRTVWSDTFVTDDVLTKCISELRRVFDDDVRNPRFIQTIPKVGYRLIPPVTQPQTEFSPLPSSEETVESKLTGQAVTSTVPSHRKRVWFAAAMLLLLGTFVYTLWLHSRSKTPAAGRTMLAVLPFQNLSGNTDQDYFSDGMTEELITQLGRAQPQKLGVIARTSAMTFKGSSQRVDEIGRQLGVDFVVEGSVRREGDRVRIAAQLIRVKDQTHLWAETYDRDTSHILQLQSEVADAIAKEISRDLLPQTSTGSRPAAVNPDAYESYLRGRYFWNKGTEDGYRAALQNFQEAIARDPNYAIAYAGLADTYNMLGYWMMAPPKDVFPLASANALKALELDPSLPEAHAALAYVKFEYDWDWQGAGEAFKRALEFNPNSSATHLWYGIYLGDQGRMEDAEREITTARALDPLSLHVNLVFSAMLYMDRKYDEALAHLHKTLELDPGFQPAYHLLAAVYEEKGQFSQAVEQSMRGLELAGYSPTTLEQLRDIFRTGGIQAFWQKDIALLEQQARHSYVSPVLIAMDYSSLREKDRAFEWLEKAYQEHSGWLLELKIDPVWDPLRSDPRFQRLMRRVGIPQ
jgi:TolB-like protein/DNA-binding winged helix-turn-helix (wHTH) protein/Tfp pilus assembly protein PilF